MSTNPSSAPTLDRNAILAGVTTAMLLSLSIYVGSQGLRHFDPAVTLYSLSSILAAFAVAYRFTIWYQRPPSRLYFQRGIQIVLGRLPKRYKPQAHAPVDSRTERTLAAVTLAKATGDKVVTQSFIRRRSWYRWIMHLCLSGGCMVAFALTFPLVFGWIHFSTLPDNAELYRVHLFGLALDQFNVHSLKASIVFNLLNFAAILVLVGLIMAALRRLTDPGERATQTFAEDIPPLILIFAVTATGLMLTVSYKFLDGRGHAGMAIVHMFSVIALLFYIPYGKLFHMLKRSASLCVSLYQKAGHAGPPARCRVCDDSYTSQMHVDDLVSLLDQLGFNYRYATNLGEVHYQEICPHCRRRLFALNQGKVLGR